MTYRVKISIGGHLLMSEKEHLHKAMMKMVKQSPRYDRWLCNAKQASVNSITNFNSANLYTVELKLI
jgi:hypothetical protein